MLKKILIANRGEIACRIIRTARKLGIATVAVYADADAKAPHVMAADEAVHIGPSPATESYLRGDKIIAAAKAAGAEGIHPGYGFLSENADFADAVTKAGLKFIGPSADAMRALGGKAAAKEIAIKSGVPVVPGYRGHEQDAKTLAAEARKIGYPVMIKAVAGGGGRGMRLVEKEADLAELLASAQREAEGAFGNPAVLIEKVVVKPRHIEVQVFGDSKGNVVHLFERDCTLQRRNQKVIEEAPAPGMSPALREKICAAAVKLAKSVGYEGAGTVEFLVEGGALGADAKWYFIEMNTRLQVEHPVTEEITGLDLVEWQMRVASGEPLPLPQDKIAMCGHAIEVRLCAEDPAKGFLPSIGQIRTAAFPSVAGLRVETGVAAGSAVSPFYDSMIAKLISVGRDRAEAIAINRQGLAALAIGGLETNALFLDRLLAHKGVAEGAMDTGLIGREIDELTRRAPDPGAIAAAAHTLLAARNYRSTAMSPWDSGDSFQLGPPRAVKVKLEANGSPAEVVLRSQDTLLAVEHAGAAYAAPLPDPICMAKRPRVDAGTFTVRDLTHYAVALPTHDGAAGDDAADGSAVRAPINGKVARIFVTEGETVEKGARIAVVEAMKMEHVLHAAKAGVIAKVAAREGQQVTQGTVLVALGE